MMVTKDNANTYTGDTKSDNWRDNKTYTNPVGIYETKGAAIGKLVDEKNIAYGDSFHQSGRILKVLYPHGIKPEQFDKALYIVRVIDKLFRLATDNDKFGESPARDIAGYSILL